MGPIVRYLGKEVPKEELAHLPELELGAHLRLQLGEGEHIVRVAKMSDSHVTLDGNHPLAGQDLVFDVEITDSRVASSEELAHGHAHGEGGHHH